MKSFFARLVATNAPGSVLLVRLMVGGIFLSEGIQKFLFADKVGAGRFAKIGLPSPEVLGPLVGGTEIVFGLLVLIGLLTRLAVMPLLIIMSVAVSTTKLPIFLNDGFWKMAHDSRNDTCMILGSIFLLIVGAGRLSFDARYLSRKY